MKEGNVMPNRKKKDIATKKSNQFDLRLIEENKLILLSDQDRDLLMQALDNPPAPNEALRGAMNSSRRSISD